MGFLRFLGYFSGVTVIALSLWSLFGFYWNGPAEQGIELTFGKVTALTGPGLNHVWPWPVGKLDRADTQQIREIIVGIGDTNTSAKESLILTGDENVVDIDFKIFWQISNIEDFFYKVQDTKATVKSVAESTLREIIGKRNLDGILTTERAEIQDETQTLLQSVLDSYQAGVSINKVELLDVTPPPPVQAAFRDVQTAKADQERAIEQGHSHANKVVPQARGIAQQTIEKATGEKERIVNDAKGQTDRFLLVRDEWLKNPEVTEERIYLEVMELVYRDNNIKLVGVDSILPLLNLGQDNLDRMLEGKK